jgi:CRP/FNR family transcriptional regulator
MGSRFAVQDSHAAGRPDATVARSRDELEALPGIGITLTIEPGQTIVVEGDPIDYYYRVVSGTVRLYRSIADGRRQVLDFLSAHDCFGLTGLDCHAYSVEAVSRVVMIRYPRHLLEAAVQSDPGLARRLFRLACAELGRAQERMLLLGRKSAEERIASFLLRLAATGDRGAEPPVITLTMSRLDIADHLGLTIETVSRTLSRFRRDGLIALPGRHEIALCRMDRIRALAEGEGMPGTRGPRAHSSSNRMRSAAPSRSSNCPLRSAHRKAQRPSSPRNRAIGIR